MLKRKYMMIAFLVCLLTATLFIGVTASNNGSGNNVTASSGSYDPWCDINDDGYVNVLDLIRVLTSLGSGPPMPNKTALLLRMETNLFQSGLLLQLPYGATNHEGNVDCCAILHSLDLNQSEPGNQTSIFVYKNTTITISGEFQRYQGGGVGGAIAQAFFIYSWTPSWPPPNDTYYHVLYNAIPGKHPGTGKQPFSFDLTVPDEMAVYYLYYCAGTEYNVEDAVNKYTQPLWVPYAVISTKW